MSGLSSSTCKTDRLRGRKWMRVRERIRQEQPLCPECEKEGRIRGWDEVDHIISLENGGTNDRENLVGLCKPHHDIKTAKDRGYKNQGTDLEGMPTNASHHWNIS